MNRLTLSAAALAIVAGSAGAAMIEMRQVGIGQGDMFKVTLHGEMRDLFAGQIVHELRNATPGGEAFEGTLITYCTEIAQHVSTDWSLYDITTVDDAPVPGPVMGPAKAQAIRNMMNAMLLEELAGRFDAGLAAAFQLAIWEVVYDFDENVGRGSLTLESGALLAASSSGGELSAEVATETNMLLDASGILAEGVIGTAFVSRTFQDQIVPTPGAAALAGVGGLMFLRRRRA
jgi:hypothetical protein